MENNDLKIGDLIIIRDSPRRPDEWEHTPGVHKVVDINLYTVDHTPKRLYIWATGHNYLSTNNIGGHTKAFDARRCINVKNLSKLEQALYAVE